MAAHFIPPIIQDNTSGWGPCAVPTEFKDIPYQPFSKGDRIGKISDWTGQFQDRNKYHSQFAGGSQYAYYHEGDESSFQLVDTSKPQKTAYQRNRQRFNNARLKREREKQQRKEAFMMGQVQPRGKQQRKNQKHYQYRRWNDRQQIQKHRDASVVVKDDWEVKEEMDFPRLSKLKLSVGPPVDLYNAGGMEYYDKSYDRITTKNEKLLEPNNRTFHRVTSSDDPIIRKLASKGNVFGTDAVISTLMCCTRSVHSWDIIVRRIKGKIFFDKRDGSSFDLLPVYETTQEEVKEEGINCAENLAVEATYINQNFSQQCLKKNDVLRFDHPNPFAEDAGDEVASVGYRYRKFDLGDGIDLIVRCEHDAALITPNNERQFLSIKALNEFDPRVSKIDWRQKLDSQIGSVLATELKNNSNKMAKWTCNAILAGSDILKIGYVSRVAPYDTSRHVILGTQQFNPKSFAQQIALDMDNAWGILRVVIDTCMKLPEGKYLLLRDPNKGVIRLYSIPEKTFEGSDSENEDENKDDDSDDDERK